MAEPSEPSASPEPSPTAPSGVLEPAESEEFAAKPRRRRPKPRRDVFERLAQDLIPPWQVGDRVLVRDRPVESEWMPGVVVAINPVQVRLKGGRLAFTWRDIKANCQSRSPSPSPTSTREPHSPSLRPASAQALRRARSLSRRRRRREKEAKQKEKETQEVVQMMFQRATAHPRLPRAAEQVKQNKARQVRDVLQEVCLAMEEAAAGKRKAASAKVLRLAKGLAGRNIKPTDLILLTVKERKKLLDFLGHPFPGAATERDAFFAWFREQLWKQRSGRGPGEPERLKESKHGDVSILEGARHCVEAAQLEDDDPKNLGRLIRALSLERMELDALLSIPQKEFKKLAERLAVKMQGMTKEDVVEKLKQQVWANRTKFAKMKGLADLTFEPRSQVLAELRKALREAEEQLQKPVTASKLSEWMGNYNMEYYQLDINNLSLLTVQELRKLTHWMDMPPLRGRAEILEWLHKDLWSDRAVRRAPSKAKLRFLQELSAARQRHAEVEEEAEEEEDDDEVAKPTASTVFVEDDGSAILMEYDMFVEP